ncbi:MAG: PAS domain-containing protein, partial [Chloroflexota bacterium]|nr:PAS domain-containing protein [Chloroflexota bacterium]
MSADLQLHQMLGFRQGELIGRTLLDVCHPHDRGLAAEYLKRSLRDVGDRHSLELRCVRRDGGAVWVNMTLLGAPVRP